MVVLDCSAMPEVDFTIVQVDGSHTHTHGHTHIHTHTHTHPQAEIRNSARHTHVYCLSSTWNIVDSSDHFIAPLVCYICRL